MSVHSSKFQTDFSFAMLGIEPKNSHILPRALPLGCGSTKSSSSKSQSVSLPATFTSLWRTLPNSLQQKHHTLNMALWTTVLYYLICPLKGTHWYLPQIISTAHWLLPFYCLLVQTQRHIKAKFMDKFPMLIKIHPSTKVSTPELHGWSSLYQLSPGHDDHTKA